MCVCVVIKSTTCVPRPACIASWNQQVNCALTLIDMSVLPPTPAPPPDCQWDLSRHSLSLCLMPRPSSISSSVQRPGFMTLSTYWYNDDSTAAICESYAWFFLLFLLSLLFFWFSFSFRLRFCCALPHCHYFAWRRVEGQIKSMWMSLARLWGKVLTLKLMAQKDFFSKLVRFGSAWLLLSLLLGSCVDGPNVSLTWIQQ